MNKPRNFVAKYMKRSGAGVHDKKSRAKDKHNARKEQNEY